MNAPRLEVLPALRPSGRPPAPLPAPGSRELAVLLLRVRAAGLPVVGVGHRYGPRLPRMRAPRLTGADRERLTPEALDDDVAAVAGVRWSWARMSRPGPGVPLDDANLTLRAGARLAPPAAGVPLRRWQPSRHPSLCLGASAALRLHGLPAAKVAALYDVAGVALGAAPAPEVLPFRDLAGIVRRGDDCWAQLGAWPWAAFAGGRLPEAWWTTHEAWSALRAYLDRALARAHAHGPRSLAAAA
jgi:hypothetical protein